MAGYRLTIHNLETGDCIHDARLSQAEIVQLFFQETSKSGLPLRLLGWALDPHSPGVHYEVTLRRSDENPCPLHSYRLVAL